jgi:hypothetical protein
MFSETKKERIFPQVSVKSLGGKIENRDFKHSIRNGGVHKKYNLEEDIKQRRNCYKT